MLDYIINLSPPAYLYLLYAIMQISYDLYHNEKKKALVKIPISIIFIAILEYIYFKMSPLISWGLLLFPLILLSFTAIFVLLLLKKIGRGDIKNNFYKLKDMFFKANNIMTRFM
tara:strand:+ start:2533 stop:2874 length:342 start_codon:yes stop_codon:yes gene_type:complete